jgi:fatty acid desaturase
MLIHKLGSGEAGEQGSKILLPAFPASLLPNSESAVRRAAWDAVFIGLAVVHGVVLAMAASIPVVALGLWWNANTIAHNFIHRPFFRSRWARRSFSIYLSAVLGIPQSYWRDRHLRHHAGRSGRARLGSATVVETLVIAAMWTALVVLAPRWFLTIYVPGYAIGLVLCWLQGHYEHEGGTTSHYGWLYNALFFNDGYHVEHHRRPSAHWTELPRETKVSERASRWPAVLRWLDAVNLDALERLVLRSVWLQRFMVDRHERAFARLLPDGRAIRRVTIVGGGLFPRTALVVRRLFPNAAVTILDASADNLEIARARVGEDVSLVHQAYDSTQTLDADLVVFPLAFHGDRARIYRHPPAPLVLVHDWMWTTWHRSTPVSIFLLKRLNLIGQ